MEHAPDWFGPAMYTAVLIFLAAIAFFLRRLGAYIGRKDEREKVDLQIKKVQLAMEQAKLREMQRARRVQQKACGLELDDDTGQYLLTEDDSGMHWEEQVVLRKKDPPVHRDREERVERDADERPSYRDPAKKDGRGVLGGTGIPLLLFAA